MGDSLGLDDDMKDVEETELDDAFPDDVEVLCRSSLRCSRPTLSIRLAVLSDIITIEFYITVYSLSIIE